MATISRSAGSPWKSVKRQLVMQIAGEMGSSSTGALRLEESQPSKSGVSFRRPLVASMDTSQTEIAETMERPRKEAKGAASAAPALIQIHAWVSRTAAPIFSRFRIPNFASVGEIGQNLGGAGCAPEERNPSPARKGNQLGRRSAIPSNHDALLFVRDVFNDREAFCLKFRHAHLDFPKVGSTIPEGKRSPGVCSHPECRLQMPVAPGASLHEPTGQGPFPPPAMAPNRAAENRIP